MLMLLSVAAFASMASMRVCDPLLTVLAKEYQVSAGVAAQTISAFAVAYGLLQLFYGPLGDRYGKTRVIGCAVAACAACNLAISVAPSLHAVIVLRGLAGAGAAGIIPLAMAWIGDTVPYEERQEVLARLMTGTIFGMIAGQWIGGFVADAVGWRPVFVGLAALFAVIAAAIYRANRAQGRGQAVALVAAADAEDAAAAGGAPARQSFIGQLAAVLRVRWARRVLLVVGIEGAFAFAAFSFVPSYLHQRFGISLGAAGAILALYGVGGMLYSFTARRLLRRFGEGGLTTAGGIGLGMSMAMLGFGPQWWWAMPACLIGGLGFYMLHSTLQTNATQMAPHVRGTAVSVFAACLFIGQSVGVLFGSLLLDKGSALTIFIAGMAVLPLLGWWFRLSLGQRDRWQGTAASNQA
jgi:predicted MFS family arabinose efflux permease